jgi:hypothetical protein
LYSSDLILDEEGIATEKTARQLPRIDLYRPDLILDEERIATL